MLTRTAPSFLRLFAVAVAVAVLTVWPHSAQAQDFDPPRAAVVPPLSPPPPGYHRETRVSPGLVGAGSAVLFITYGAALASAVSSQCANNRWMALPIAGAFIASEKYRTAYVGACDDPEGIVGAMVMQDGIAQSVGALLVAGALLFPAHRVVPDAPTISWQVAPVALGYSGGGLEVFGRF